MKGSQLQPSLLSRLASYKLFNNTSPRLFFLVYLFIQTKHFASILPHLQYVLQRVPVSAKGLKSDCNACLKAQCRNAQIHVFLCPLFFPTHLLEIKKSFFPIIELKFQRIHGWILLFEQKQLSMILFVLIMALSLANGIESITTVLKQEGKGGGSKTVLLNQI